MSSARREESEPDTAPLLAALRAQDPGVVRPLWERYAPLVMRVLHCALKAQRQVDEAVRAVFHEVFRAGPSLPPDAELRMIISRAVSRTVERLSPPPRSAWDPNTSARTIRGRTRTP